MMPDRPTTEWVSVTRVIPHPDNSNEMTDEEAAKLEANCPEGLWPPLIVRSLELTQAFDEERKLDKLQIIDGEHRWLLANKRRDKLIEVRVWSDVTDQRAKKMLLTLNGIHGHANQAKRGRLIRDLHDFEPDPDMLATILPETADQIKIIIEEVNREAIHDATSRARKLSERQPMTIFCMPKQAEKIRRAIKKAQSQMDESHQHTECEEGEALSVVADKFLEAE